MYIGVIHRALFLKTVSVIWKNTLDTLILKKVDYRAGYATYVQSVDFISSQAHTNGAYLKSSAIIVEVYFPFHAFVHFSNSFHLFVLLF